MDPAQPEPIVVGDVVTLSKQGGYPLTWEVLSIDRPTELDLGLPESLGTATLKSGQTGRRRRNVPVHKLTRFIPERNQQ